MVNEVSSDVVITPDKTIITYLLKEDDWQKDAAKQCKENNADYLPLVGQRVRRVGESYTHNGIEKLRSGEHLTIEIRMQPVDQNPLPPPARVIVYCGGGFQGWRKLGPSPAFEWCPIGSDSCAQEWSANHVAVPVGFIS